MPAENPLRNEQSPFDPQDASAGEPRAPEAGGPATDGATADAPPDAPLAGPEAEPLLAGDSRTFEPSSGPGDAPADTGAPAPGLEAGGAAEPAPLEAAPGGDATADAPGADGDAPGADGDAPRGDAPPEDALPEAALALEAGQDVQASGGADAEGDAGGRTADAEGGGTGEPLPAESSLRRRAQVAPALIALDRIDDDATFRMRPEGDVSRLATDVARVGQLFPVDVRLTGPDDRFQLVCGFRRVAALRFLHREFVLARVHTELGDEDALLMALVAAIHAAPVEPAQLEQVRESLSSQGLLFAAARDMLEKALAPDDDLSPGEDEEVDADQLAGEVAERLGTVNQDLALVADEEVFRSLEPARREELLRQLRYSRDLVLYFESLGE